MTPAETGVSWSGRHAVVTMPAEIDMANSAMVTSLLAAVIGEDSELITADLTGTRFCDSAGVHALARAAEQSAARGSEFRVAVADSAVTQVLQLSGLDQVVPVYPSVQRSLDAPRSGRSQLPAAPRPAGAGPPAEAARGALPQIQEALLPAALPVLPQARIAAYYLAAAQDQAAGGDWFDAVTRPDSSVALVVGDVAGHGVPAAAAMGLLRAAMNDLLATGPELVTVLSRVDAFATRFPALHAATLVLAVLDPSDGTMRYVTCGHRAPLVLSRDRPARFLPETGTGPLGTGSAPVLASTQLQPGELVLLCSNGLTARPNRAPAECLADLAKVASDAIAGRTVRAGGTATAADRLCQLPVELLAGAGYADDVAALAAHWLPEPAPELHCELPAEAGTVRAMRRSFGDWLSQLDPLVQDRDALLLAVTEVVTNAAEHAYPPGQPGLVELHASVSNAGELECRITDHGTWRVPDPGHAWRGQGLMVAAHLVNQMRVQHLPQDAAAPPGARGTLVTLRHHLTRPAVLMARSNAGPAARVDGPAFSVTASAAGPVARVTVAGPLDTATADRLAGQLLAACRGGTLPLTADLRQVTLLTSAGVRILYQVRQQLNAHHQQLTLITEPGSPTAAVVELVRLSNAAPGGDLT